MFDAVRKGISTELPGNDSKSGVLINNVERG